MIIKKILAISLFVFLLSSCSSVVSINPKEIVSYSNELNAKEPYEEPFISYFKKRELLLTFVAANHVENEDNSTCKTIRDEFKKNQYNFLLVEGMAFSQINNESDIQYAKDCEKNNYKNCGEDVCAINEALRQNTSFNYAEPSDLTIKEEIMRLGYTAEELVFFYGLRQIPQLKRQGINDIEGLKKKMISYLERASLKRIKLDTVFTLSAFEKMYFKKYGKNINYLEVTTDDVSPRVDNNPSWANTMSHDVGVIRNEFIMKMVEERVNSYKKVIIVYGSGHLVQTRDALMKAFGSVENVKTH